MTRRGLGRGRLLIGIGALLALVAMPIDWYKVGGVVTSITPISGNGFQGASIVVFVAAIALLAVLTLPYAARDEQSSFDRPLIYAAVVGAGIIGFLVRIVQLNGEGALSLPDRSPGLWLAGAGLATVAWGVAEILAQPAAPKR